jgi:ATP-binding cassette subfamily B protein
VGENGSGKTTLVKLLCRLYDPVSGQITLEDISLNQFAPESLRKEISVIFQDFVQYHLTVEDNVRFGNIDQNRSTIEPVKEAARCSGVHTVIENLPNGYATILGKLFKDGVELSIGQWQMVALARAFLRNGRLIVLDEPTSSLDPNSEYQIFSRFRSLLKGKSAILISHRFSTVRMADRIVVLKNGQIEEIGSHNDLMAMQGYYSDLFSKQAACYQR